ncbi:MAG: T9SS type A sorting domain-containing protein [Saprospiraceae bacterium]|nr:T9SS type A sorting domain-containing protein [Saprospiraceae bacterium]
MILGQQVWPGDINNNGIVNNIDVLYWAVAKDATGDGRVSPTSSWVGQDLPATPWDQSFPNGLNYAYADCDGDGDVDDDDKAIIEDNFGLMHGEVVPDDYTIGDPASDPTLALSNPNAVVPSGGTLEAGLSLGTATDSISNFYGIAFTVVYDPDVVGNQGNDFQLDIFEDTWMNGMGDDKVIKFIQNDRDAGVAEIAIVRKNQQMVSGFGEIGTFSIVMEDIVVGLTKINTTDIKMIDLAVTDTPIAISDIEFSIDSITATVRPIAGSGIKVYPNPVLGSQVSLELEDSTEGIRQLQLFDANGRLISRWKFEQRLSKQIVDLRELPTGIYNFKIITDKRVYIQSFFK